MPFITPFKGIRYDLHRVGSLARVVTPPYDLISPEGQAQYYRRHPWNFVRVVFGKELPSDTSTRNRYSRAKETLDQWLRAGILKADSEPGLYPYLQVYSLGGRRYRRWGVIALVRLDSKRIYPHEETREAPKQDRLKLLQTVQASLSPIFGLIPDAQGEYQRFVVEACRRERPIAEVRMEGVSHRIWKMSDPAWIRKLTRMLRPKELIIADGHHRFEAALAYRDACRKKDPSYTPSSHYNFAMFYLASAGVEEPGLLPTHRILHGISRRQLSGLVEGMKGLRWVQPMPSLRVLNSRLGRLRAQGRVGIGLTTGNGVGYLLQAQPGSSYELDVEWLHQEILPSWFWPGWRVSYTQDLDLALRQIRKGKAQALFVVQPPALSQVFERARSSIRMPGKTTYFHPKPLAGLVEYVWGQVSDLSPDV